jgi:tRNA-2-methylthio-N6-dimethylallyladenosine synthase
MGRALSKFYIMTYGCQMNAHDSERMAAQLSKAGLLPTTTQSDADVIIFNTCSVREKPEEKLDNMLDHLKHFKRQKPHSVIAVAGCIAQQKGHELTKKFPFIDMVLGPDCENDLLTHINKIINKDVTSIVKTDFTEGFSYSDTLYTQDSVTKSSGYVVAMKGCNSYCSYCIVPYVRGKEYSRPVNEVVEDVKKMVDAGITSITLLGQNIAKYGFDTGSSLYKLLKEASKVAGLKRLAFLSFHPKDFSSDIIKAYLEIEQLSPMLHLPAQHGSDKILKAMNRGYTRAQYLSIIEGLKKAGLLEKITISTDVIIGFPGETEADYNDLVSLLQEVRYDNSFSFIYSPRPGTAAYNKYGSSVSQEDHKIYSDRLNKYHALQKQIAFEKNSLQVGQIMEVLVEGYSEKDPTKLSARTGGWKVAILEGNTQSVSPGQHIMVKIVKAHPTHFTGEVLL